MGGKIKRVGGKLESERRVGGTILGGRKRRF